MTYYIYILYSADIDRYYVGCTSDPVKRYLQHLSNGPRAYTGQSKDWEMRALFAVSDQESEAIKIERFIKRQKSRNLLERLCRSDFVPDGVLSQLVRVPQMRD